MHSASGRRSLPHPPASVVLALSLVPAAFVVACFVAFAPANYLAVGVFVAASPLLLVAGMRAPLGALLAVALVSPPVVQRLVQGSPEGIPILAVAPLFGVEALLLLRGLWNGQSISVRPLELCFLAAILALAVVGWDSGDRRVWLSELVETANLILLLWLLRLVRFRFDDLRAFVIAGHLVAAPFFAWYILTAFGAYRIDFYFGMSATLVPVTAAVLLHQPLKPLLRSWLTISSALMLLATAAAGNRGTTLVAMLAVGIIVLVSLRRFSFPAVVAGFSILFVGALTLPLTLSVAEEVAPEAVERFRTVSDSPTLNVRLLEAADAFSAFQEAPLGHGLGAVLITRHEIIYESTGIAIRYGPTTYVHNSYAWYLAKTGIFGFVALIALVGSAVLGAVSRLSSGTGEATLGLALLFAAMVGAWGGPTLHNVLQTPWIALGIFMALGPATQMAAQVLRVPARARAVAGDRAPAMPRPIRPLPPV